MGLFILNISEIMNFAKHQGNLRSTFRSNFINANFAFVYDNKIIYLAPNIYVDVMLQAIKYLCLSVRIEYLEITS